MIPLPGCIQCCVYMSIPTFQQFDYELSHFNFSDFVPTNCTKEICIDV